MEHMKQYHIKFVEKTAPFKTRWTKCVRRVDDFVVIIYILE